MKEPGHHLEGSILRDADVLDIQRVLVARNHFDATRLEFWHDRRIPADAKQTLIDETWSLIRLTETPELKRRLEHSGALYFHLMHVLVQAQREQSSYPLLFSLLEELFGYDDRPDDLKHSATDVARARPSGIGRAREVCRNRSFLGRSPPIER